MNAPDNPFPAGDLYNRRVYFNTVESILPVNKDVGTKLDTRTELLYYNIYQIILQPLELVRNINYHFIERVSIACLSTASDFFSAASTADVSSLTPARFTGAEDGT